MSTPRYIAVDDTHLDIQYSGPWFLDTSGRLDTDGNFGPPYQDTLHGVNSDASLSFNFSGTGIILIGPNIPIPDGAGVKNHSWECFVDGVSIGATEPFQFVENNWILCNNLALMDGPHVLTVNATIRTQTFWIDQIQYVPSNDSSLDGKTVVIDDSDADVQNGFGRGWEPLSNITTMTQVTNSSFFFRFTGTSLSWYGILPALSSNFSALGSYSIDGGLPTSFILEALSPTDVTQYHQKFFSTASLPAEMHQIIVVYHGNGSTTPLNLDYLIVNWDNVDSDATHSAQPLLETVSTSISNSTAVTTPTATESIASPNSTESIPSPNSSPSNLPLSTHGHSDIENNSRRVAIIIGSSLGGLLLIGLVSLCISYILRRSKQKQVQRTNLADAIQPRPFISSPLRYPTYRPFGPRQLIPAPKRTKINGYSNLRSTNGKPISGTSGERANTRGTENPSLSVPVTVSLLRVDRAERLSHIDALQPQRRNGPSQNLSPDATGTIRGQRANRTLDEILPQYSS